MGFPLHPPGKPGTVRGDHLGKVSVPMLFLQGTRDAFAKLDLLVPVVKKLGKKATLRLIEGADHSFHAARGHGKTDADVMDELVKTTGAWAAPLCR